MKKKILVTGFEPFGGDTRNPSGEAVIALPSSEDYEMGKLILPVSWKRAFPEIEKAWDAWKPDALLMVGLAAGASAIRIERVGINLCGATKDIDGLYADGTEDSCAEKPILADAPDAFFVTYDEKKILDALKKAEIPAKYSYSAGTYICNYLLYSSLAKRKREDADMQIGFIHVPYAEGQREDFPSMPLDTIVSALETVLSEMF
ncbi:MAG: pyroglutamyl-peptidase I [Clostridia bacterium]|nr:pyroglutamyl-peptidase I [Clostridia bacterium]